MCHNQALPGEYWTQHYVARIQPGGRFAIPIAEPMRSDGELKLWSVFVDGVTTGNGKARSEQGAIVLPYRFEETWMLK
jgi:hypothetical protein